MLLEASRLRVATPRLKDLHENTKAGRFPALDGLRGIAVLAVVFYHINRYGVESIPGGGVLYTRLAQTYSSLCEAGWLGVDLFFVLSGFLITGILWDAKDAAHYYRNFYVRRTLRITPLYYSCLAIITFVLLPTLRAMPSASQLTEHPVWPAWTYALNWTIGLHEFRSTSTLYSHFWSLCVEEQFYLLWPFCVRRLNGRSLAALATAFVVTAPLIRVGLYAVNGPAASYTPTICRIDALAIGSLLALAFRNRNVWARICKLAPWAGACSTTAICVVIIANNGAENGSPLMNTVGIAFADLGFASLLALSLAWLPGQFGGKLLTSSPLRCLGKYSYCIYLVHQPVVVLLATAGFSATMLFQKTHNPWLALLAVNASVWLISIGIALLSWNLLEKHFLRWKDRFPSAPASTTQAIQPL